MSRPIIEVTNVSKRYRLGEIGAKSLREEASALLSRLRGHSPESSAREFWALRDVSFQIQPGEVVGIIGRNGAGKSTLLKVLSRITEPTSGRAVLRGRVASLLEVGTGFHPDLSGRDNIFLNGAILGMSRAEIRAKFDEIVAFAEVEKFIDTPVKRYSSGMYVRLAFAVAAHLDPEILIVDEVLAVGDAQFQQKCLGKIEEASSREGRAILIVSHNLSVVANLCQRVIYLREGRLIEDGDPRHVIPTFTKSTAILAGMMDLSQSNTKRRGDLTVQFIKVRLTDPHGVVLPVAIEGEPFSLKFEFEVKKSVQLEVLDFTIVDPGGNDLFTGKLFDKVPIGSLQPGCYYATAKFASNFFAQGSYTVRLACFGPHFYEYDHIHHAFTLLIGPAKSEKPGFSRRPGTVRFVLDWELTPASQTAN